MNNDILKNKIYKIANLVGILLVVFLAVVSIKEFKSISYVGKDNALTNTIMVNGKGEAVSIPDIAMFSFGVTENAKTVEVAQSTAATKINAALKALKDADVEDRDIKTTSYGINPHYDYTSSRSVLNGYDVSQNIEVKIRDIKKAGALFTAVGSLGVQNINSLNFSIDDIDTVKAKARDLAIKNAQEKARTLARQLGVSLVRIVNFSEDGFAPVFPYATDMGVSMMKAQSATAPEVPTGEQKIISNVSITYEIH